MSRSKNNAPKSFASTKKIGKWLCPSTANGQLSWSVNLGTGKKEVRSNSSPLRKVTSSTVIGKRLLGMIGPMLKSGEEPVGLPALGTVIQTAQMPLGKLNSETWKVVLS